MKKKEKYGFVYIWRDRKNKRYYIGSHWGYETDRYICSSNWMRNSYKRRPGDFKRRILARVTTDRSDLLIEEQRWLNMIRDSELKGRYYNFTLSVKNFMTWWVKEDGTYFTVKEKISKRRKEFLIEHPEFAENMRTLKLKQYEENPEIRASISSTVTESWKDEEVREKTIAAQNLGKAERWEKSEFHEKASSVAIEIWEREGFKESMSESQRRHHSEHPERAKNLSASMKKHLSENPGAASQRQLKRYARERGEPDSRTPRQIRKSILDKEKRDSQRINKTNEDRVSNCSQ